MDTNAYRCRMLIDKTNAQPRPDNWSTNVRGSHTEPLSPCEHTAALANRSKDFLIGRALPRTYYWLEHFWGAFVAPALTRLPRNITSLAFPEHTFDLAQHFRTTNNGDLFGQTSAEKNVQDKFFRHFH